MTTAAGSESLEEAAPPVVVATRTIGGLLLVLIGVALALAGLFWFFIVPWFGWAADGFWYTMAEWADLGGVVTGVVGFLLLVLGGGLMQRARKKRFAMFVDPTLTGATDALLDDGRGETRTGDQPTTIL